MPTTLPCPLCGSLETGHFHTDRRREYLRCAVCDLVFVPPRFFLTAEQEKACYDQHENDPEDPRYRQFLSRLAEPLIARLAPGATGLDFGSGPGPTLSVMLREAGFPTTNYDPFYVPDETALAQTYDFITATEVAEHLHQPGRQLAQLWQILRPGGYLGIMTKRVINHQAFTTWHYKNDPTHVTFFAEETFVWLAERWEAELEILGADVVILRKPISSTGDERRDSDGQK